MSGKYRTISKERFPFEGIFWNFKIIVIVFFFKVAILAS